MDINRLSAEVARLSQGKVAAATEADYLRLWQQGTGGSEDRLSGAVLGGALADRLAWVFVAGYQQAIRQSFDISVSGWLAYCASEDRTGRLPGVSASVNAGGWLLNGNKTWVAAVDHVAQLVVTVGRAPTRCFLINAEAEGVRLSARSAPDFLTDLSQGVAELTQVQVSETLTRTPGPPFNILEAVAIYSAFCGFALTSFTDTTADRPTALIAQAAELWGRRLTAEVVAGLKDLDQQIQLLASELDALAETSIPGWLDDRRLIRMYSRGIQSLES